MSSIRSSRVRASSAIRIVAASCLAFATVACGGATSEPSAAKPAEAATATATAAGGGRSAGDAAAEAKSIFTTRCAPCHGAEGKGDGAASKALVPPPRSFHDAVWQDSVTDEHIERIVMYGGAAVGKSPTMPNNPDLVAKTDVVQALRQHVRSLRGASAAP